MYRWWNGWPVVHVLLSERQSTCNQYHRCNYISSVSLAMYIFQWILWYHHIDDIFKCIFNENVWISLKLPLQLFPRVPINSIPAMDMAMFSRRPGDTPWSEPIIISLMTHVRGTPRLNWYYGINNNSRPLFFEMWLLIHDLILTTVKVNHSHNYGMDE